MESSSQESQIFECFICLQVIKLKLAQTSCCKKIYCQKHTNKFQNKCPYCRQTPFQYEENEELNRQLQQFKIKDFIMKNTFKCSETGCQFEDQWNGFLNHMSQVHNKVEDESFVAKIIKMQENREFLKEKQEEEKKAKEDSLRPSRGVRKIATEEQRQQMQIHVNNCQHQGCQHLWQGPWGPFIGGEMGRTHFDLTSCQEGKTLNLIIGWNYDNPAF